MAKCDDCQESFTEGVKCSACERNLDLKCANLTKDAYKKLGEKKVAAWKCSECKVPPPTLNAVMKKLTEMDTKLCTLQAVSNDVKAIKDDLRALQAACTYNDEILTDHGKRLTKLEETVPELRRLQETISDLSAQVTSLQRVDDSREQWARLNNVEVKGVPMKKDENLFTIAQNLGSAIGYSITKEQINYISRVPTYNPKEKSIIMNFTNRYVKEEFVANARAMKQLTTNDIQLPGENRIYINDHLSSASKKLLTMTKEAAKAKNYRFTWVKYCKIHVRKDEESKVLVVSSANDLNKII